ncbi:MAG: hypothetical protein EOP10_00810 [Proteobacteria bacterium]|nr:MAG: hypothetical protein EOP10_00810 [Pseudomonadota bacterium]
MGPDLSHNEESEYESRVKPLIVPLYVHHEAGLSLTLRDMTIYLLDENDFKINSNEFDPTRHEHAIPKFEMARVYILVCALTGDDLGLRTADKETDPVYPIYEMAFQKLVRTETDKALFPGIARVGVSAGFHTQLN